MNLGPKPVSETGTLAPFDNRVGAVSQGHVMVLLGPGGSMELSAGAKTSFGLRSRYPRYVLVSLAVSDIGFSYTHTSDDRRDKFVVNMTGEARVVRAAEFQEGYANAPVGAPLQKVLLKKIKRIATLYGKNGVEVVREQLVELEYDLNDEPLIVGGVELVSCCLEVEADPVSVILGILEKQGAQAYPNLRMQFPKLSNEVKGWIEDLYTPQKYHRRNVEENVALMVQIAEALRAQGIDSDEVLGIVSLPDIADQVRLGGQSPAQLQLGSTPPPKLERRED